MDPILVAEIIVIVIIIYVLYKIYRWFNARYDICGAKDVLCYITGHETTKASIVQDLGFNKLLD